MKTKTKIKTKKYKFKHLYIEIYRFNIYYVRCTFDAYVMMIKNEFNEDISKVNSGSAAKFEVYMKNGIDIGVMWFSPEESNKSLAHECFHAVHYLLQKCGISLVDATEEAYAYLLQYLILNIKV